MSGGTCVQADICMYLNYKRQNDKIMEEQVLSFREQNKENRGRKSNKSERL